MGGSGGGGGGGGKCCVLVGGGGGTLNTGYFGPFLGAPGNILDDAKDRNKERNEQTKGCQKNRFSLKRKLK